MTCSMMKAGLQTAIAPGELRASGLNRNSTTLGDE